MASTTSTMAPVAPEAWVRAPRRMLASVAVGAPAPGRPPKSPATVLPRPAPISSRFGLCRCPVSESAAMAFSKLLRVPISATMTAGWTAPAREPPERSRSQKSGRLSTASAILGASLSQSALITVPITRAAVVEGT